VLNALAGVLRDTRRLIDTLHIGNLAAAKLSRAGGEAAKLAVALESASCAEWPDLLHAMVRRIVLHERSLGIELSREALLSRILGSERFDEDHVSRREPPLLRLTFTPVRRGVEARLVLDEENKSVSRISDTALIKAVARGHSWFEQLARGDVGSMRDLAAAEGISERFVAQQIELAFLAPLLVDRILDAQAFPIRAKRLTLSRLPLAWSEQMGLADTPR
jgi:site-specific DNA recombinase